MPLLKSRCQKRLAVLWFTGGGLIFLLLLLQTFLGRYGDQAREAWSWFLPTIMPTLSLIAGVIASDALGRSARAARVDPFTFRLAYALSVVYLAIVSLTLLLSPFSPLPQLELMRLSNLWLGPLQGLAGAVLGFFFVATDRHPRTAASPAAPPPEENHPDSA
ncbi:hypothetical protein GQ464_012095 [Rhodocaloribacter litoris]|uniref:hypothetical protein n=1 Tax=Rhodocaloribacter litoris TaxID=2558931 RepID=UPI0014237A12|nr:hypothetical protein [Rhodocaloribacter litoris]QXD14192.1 hypothetical protein GQ464_012095 [Rhodocaloribacter litoris]